VSTDQAFNESRARSEDLAKLLRGESPDPPPNTESKVKWNEKVANRPPLMARLNTAREERLNSALSDASAFAKNIDQALHEAQVVAAIAAAIQKEGYEDADAEDYREYARTMQKAALDLSQAAKNKNYDAARTAFGVIKKCCDDCHGTYQ
jgi:hypothetical protein